MLLLVSEPELRSTSRVSRELERYNLSSGKSYIQYCHNLVKQDKEKCLEYSESETEIVAHIVTKMHKECFAQKYMLGKGRKVFGTSRPPACKVELKQMYEQKFSKAIVVAELNRPERVRSQ